MHAGQSKTLRPGRPKGGADGGRGGPGIDLAHLTRERGNRVFDPARRGSDTAEGDQGAHLSTDTADQA